MVITQTILKPTIPRDGEISLVMASRRPKSAPSEQSRLETAEEFMSNQVRAAEAVAASLYERSTLLIAGGIVMAFIGVGVFYFTLPETKDASTMSAFLPRVIRPTGILIFLEAISWFLLRQYRVQIEDYKAFYRIYLRRANLLMALKTLPKGNSSDAGQIAIAAAFLEDDQTGRLRSGETTEALATLKVSDPNPVFDLFRDLIGRVLPTKPEATENNK